MKRKLELIIARTPLKTLEELDHCLQVINSFKRSDIITEEEYEIAKSETTEAYLIETTKRLYVKPLNTLGGDN